MSSAEFKQQITIMQYKKVIWRDGQAINPGYLQQQNKYFETLISHQNPSLYNWGFWALEFDQDNLRQGEIRLINGRGIFPDGTLFDISDLPQPLSLNLAVQEIPSITRVYLGIPLSNEQEIDFNLETQKENTDNLCRYQVVPYSCQDITHPPNTQSEFDLKLAIPNIQILLETDLETQHVQWLTMPIAQIKLDNAQVVLDQTYWPPCLNSFSESTLTGQQLKRINNNVLEKLAQLRGHLQANLTDNSFGAFTVNHFLLHLVNKYQAVLTHLATLPQVHPEAFFRYLLSLVTELTALTAEYPKVRYEHDEMSNGFTNLHQRLVSFIEQHLNQKESLILTLSGKPYPGVAQFKSADKFEMKPNVRLILEIAQHLKVLMVAQDRFIQNLYQSLSEGLQLRQLDKQLPEKLRKRQGYCYYELELTNDKKADYLSVYVQDEQLGENHELTLWFT